MTHAEHTYQSHLAWEGSTGAGYAVYERAHTVVVMPSRVATPRTVTMGLAKRKTTTSTARLLEPLWAPR